MQVPGFNVHDPSALHTLSEVHVPGAVPSPDAPSTLH